MNDTILCFHANSHNQIMGQDGKLHSVCYSCMNDLTGGKNAPFKVHFISNVGLPPKRKQFREAEFDLDS